MNARLAIFAIGLCFSQCRYQEPEPTPTELTIQFIEKLRPQLVGTWQVRQAQISHKKLVSVYYSTGITKDTSLQNVATLTFQPSTDKHHDPRILKVEGTLRFRAKEYPVYANVSPTQLDTQAKGILFIDYNFKESGIDITSPEVDYIESIGLIQENFAIETVLGEPTMTWKGLNRAIVSASLYKQ